MAFASGAARAQVRAEDNALTSAEDAFGTSIGLQNIGLYSLTDARGFNPQQAENVRIEGLYFDLQSYVVGNCMVRETTMRIGIAAQSYSFPAPTGIADLSLRAPGDTAAFSGSASRGPYEGSTLQLEQQFPLAPKTLSVDMCAALYNDFLPDLLRHDHSTEGGATLRWRPVDGTEIVPFWNYLSGGGRQALEAVYTDGSEGVPRFRERGLASQTWTTQGWRMLNFGAVVRSDLGSAWKVTGGAFHSQEHDPLNYSPYLQLNPNGTADSVVDVTPPLRAMSTSAEARLSGTSIEGTRRRRFEITIRGRDVSRSHGGDDNLDFGNIGFFEQTLFAKPSVALTPSSEDLTRQLDAGVSYEETWQGVGSAAIGVLKDHYRRTSEVPSFASNSFRTAPWLPNLRFTLEGPAHLAYYASYVQGLEDSALAPIVAVNQGESPPAARTWQADGGLRFLGPGEKFRAILGVFDIHKPYLNVDTANVYRTLGRLRNEGVETSLSYADHGFTVLAGGVLIKPHVELTAPQPGVVGSVPVGPVPLTLTANLDYAPGAWGPWAASVQWNRLSTRYETADDRQRLPPLATVGAGVRYQWKHGGHSWTLRFDTFNLTNAQGLHASALDQFIPEDSRRCSLTLAADLS